MADEDQWGPPLPAVAAQAPDAQPVPAPKPLASPAPAPTAALQDQWGPALAAPVTGEGYNVRSSLGPPLPPSITSTPASEDVMQKSGTTNIFKAFSSGYMETSGFGHDPVGLSADTIKTFQDWGLFNKDLGHPTGLQDAFKTFNETLFMGGALVLHGTMGVLGGLQAAAVEAGAPKDFVSLPDAFAGSPENFHMPAQVREVVTNPAVREGIDKGAVNKANDVPYMAGASASSDITNIDKHVPDIAELPSGAKFPTAPPLKIHEQVEKAVMENLIRGGMQKDAAYKIAHWEYAEKAEDAWYKSQGVDAQEAEDWWAKQSLPILKENAGTHFDAYHGTVHDFEQFDSSKIGSGEGAQSYGHGIYVAENPDVATEYKNSITQAQADKPVPPGGAFYKVRVNASPAHFLDWDEPLSEQHPRVQKALNGLGINPKSALDGRDAYEQLVSQHAHNSQAASDALRDAGVPGIKYLDQGSRHTAFVHGDDVAPGDITHNYVVFDDKLISITHKEIDAKSPPADLYDKPYPNDQISGARHEHAGTEKPTPVELAQAKKILGQDGDTLAATLTQSDLYQMRELGVIGPERKTVADREPGDVMKPSDALDERMKGMAPVDRAWLQNTLSKIDQLKGSTDEQKEALRQAVLDRPDLFSKARAGEIPRERYQSMSELTGIAPDELTGAASKLMKNDVEMRVVLGALEKANAAAVDAARLVKEDDIESLKGLQEAVMRRDQLLEQAVGLKAEWGRTGNVIQEFLDTVNDAQSMGKFLAKNGRDLEGLKKLARALKTTNNPENVGRLLTDMRKPTNWDKFMEIWTNGLLAGVFTHTRYAIGNSLFALYDAGLVAPVAGSVGAVRQVFTKGDIDRVFIGEGPARVWGMVRGTQDALVAASAAIRDGVAPLNPREITLGERAVEAGRRNPYTQAKRAISGTFGNVVSVPSRVIGGIHTFFDTIGYRAQIEAEAYRSAAKAGFSPTEGRFWEHMANKSRFPSEDTLDRASTNGDRMTFTEELGPKGQAAQRFLNTTKVGKMVVPFLRVASNVYKGSLEALMPLVDNKMRDVLMGRTDNEIAKKYLNEARGDKDAALAQFDADANEKTGEGTSQGQAAARSAIMNRDVQRDTQIARWITGAMVGSTVAYWAAEDRITDSGPANPKDYQIWRMTHQPNSVRIGNQWVSYKKVGPLGPFLGQVAGLTRAIQEGVTDNVDEAISRLVLDASDTIVNEVGLQGLGDLVEAIRDPERHGGSYTSDTVSSFLPWAVGTSQWASFKDPYVRRTDSLLDVIKTHIPGERETLYPVRDMFGRPVANSRYEWGSFMATRPMQTDPVYLAISAAGIKPANPEKSIGGVPLTPEQYDHFQTLAGAMAYTTIQKTIAEPSWANVPDPQKAMILQKLIAGTRRAAEMRMNMSDNGALLKDHQQVLHDRFEGIKPAKKDIGQTLGITQ